MGDFWYYMRIILTPSCWIRVGSTDKAWDSLVQEQLKNPVFTNNKEFTVELNGVELWIGNYPCKYGTDHSFGYGNFGTDDYLPSMVTVFKLKDAIDKWLIEYIKG